MVNFRSLIIVLSFGFFGVICYAGYAQLSPPIAWSPVPVGGAVGSFNYGAAANSAKIAANGTVLTNAALNVGGRAVSVPVSLRFAANASKFAASAIFINPYLAAGVAVASWLASSKISWSDSGGGWIKEDETVKKSDGFEYSMNFSGQPEKFFLDKQDACDYSSAYFFSGNFSGGNYSNHFTRVSGDYCVYGAFNKEQKIYQSAELKLKIRNGSCPAGWYITPAGCSMLPPPKNVNEEEFLQELQKNPMPSKVPQEIPSPLPVEVPQINPNPEPSPFFVPTGDPVPNPNYDPSKPISPANPPNLQPGVRVRPSNDPSAPWQVDVSPVDRPILDPNASPDRNPDFGSNPNGETPSKNPEQSDLCEKNPDILACQKLGQVTPEKLKDKKVVLDIKKEDGFGPSSGVCPAPKTFSVMGKSFSFSWGAMCDFANGIRPLFIGFAYLSAALAFLGLSRRGS